MLTSSPTQTTTQHRHDGPCGAVHSCVQHPRALNTTCPRDGIHSFSQSDWFTTIRGDTYVWEPSRGRRCVRVCVRGRLLGHSHHDGFDVLKRIRAPVPLFRLRRTHPMLHRRLDWAQPQACGLPNAGNVLIHYSSSRVHPSSFRTVYRPHAITTSVLTSRLCLL